jgi:CubicO group peptidase (beta-lactamase class C family)
MKGLWVNHIMYSKARDMARFGLLMLANGIWNGDTLLHNQQYLYDMTHPSQPLNKSYGYLWWLNGQESFMLPDLQFVFPFKLLSNAPDDLYAALGKNDQKIHVVPSKGWVIVRQGNDAGYVGPGGGSVPIQFDNDMWKYLNAWQVQSAEIPDRLELFDTAGKKVLVLHQTQTIPARDLPQGHYWLKCQIGEKITVKLLSKG